MIIEIVTITIIFLLAACFLVLYVLMYNKRKRRHLEEKEAMQKEFQRELGNTRMEVQEQTLQTIASDIHDNVGQILSLTRLSLSSVDRQQLPELANNKIGTALDLLDKSIKELRHLAAILHASDLLKQGLCQAVERELNRLEKIGSFSTSLTAENPSFKLPEPNKELIIFRIIQELLNNIIKHARATRIDVGFECHNDTLLVLVKDNGIGFNIEDALANSSGIGLGNIQKRLKLIGGTLQLESEINKGTNVKLIIPINSKRLL